MHVMYPGIDAQIQDRGAIGCPGMGVPLVLRKYNIAKKLYNTGPVQVPLGNNVNGFTVHNTGNTIVRVNNEPLQPGESQTVGGNEGEVYIGQLTIDFRLPTPAPGTPVNAAWVSWKFYVP